MIREGRAKGNPESRGLRNYLEKGLKDRQIALNRAKALCNQSKSPEEFYQKLQDEIDKIKIYRQKELDEVSAKDINEDKKKEERKIINNKYDFRQGAYLNYLPQKKDEPKPVDEPKTPVGSASDDRQDNQSRIVKNPTELENDIAETNHKTHGRSTPKKVRPRMHWKIR